jgi:hypothetical protein
MGVAYDLRPSTDYENMLRINYTDLLNADETQHISGTLKVYDEVPLVASSLTEH